MPQAALGSLDGVDEREFHGAVPLWASGQIQFFIFLKVAGPCFRDLSKSLNCGYRFVSIFQKLSTNSHNVTSQAGTGAPRFGRSTACRTRFDAIATKSLRSIKRAVRLPQGRFNRGACDRAGECPGTHRHFDDGAFDGDLGFIHGSSYPLGHPSGRRGVGLKFVSNDVSHWVSPCDRRGSTIAAIGIASIPLRT